MDLFSTYIIFSKSHHRFYVGHTNNLESRIFEHNSGQTKSTRYGIPWELIFTKDFTSKSEAGMLEMKIKKRGIRSELQSGQEF